LNSAGTENITIGIQRARIQNCR